jgi:nicotinamidase-related amidase
MRSDGEWFRYECLPDLPDWIYELLDLSKEDWWREIPLTPYVDTSYTPQRNNTMPQVIRVDVDTQIDFCHPSGALYVPAPVSVLVSIEDLVFEAHDKQIPVIGSVDNHSHDAWEFKENGGPFPAHCVKGTMGALKIIETTHMRKKVFIDQHTDDCGPAYKTRYIPMTHADHVVVGEAVPGQGARWYTPDMFVDEVRNKNVGVYFEKEVYSAFSNPNAKPFIRRLVNSYGGPKEVVFEVFGYCTGMTPTGDFFCVGSMAKALREEGYNVAILTAATAPLGDAATVAESFKRLAAMGIELR